MGIGPEVDRQEGLIEKIGILGGTFDPVHNGHLVKAGEALERLELDRVLFMVAGDPWMKRETGQTVSPAHHRLEMVRLAVAGDPAFVTDDREVRRPGPTYTVDTLDELAAGHHGADLFLLLGSDTLASLRDWHMPRRVLELAQVVVLDRPGTAPGVAALDRIAPGASARTHVLPGCIRSPLTPFVDPACAPSSLWLTWPRRWVRCPPSSRQWPLAHLA